ncbi:PQQ-dependent sugar dehydrogenase [Caulobacter hibisci]|uniref:PQQ-dependent sugar dehydrogenase n=1 Tax=Caulobacter hibisci TaxID=2035993 RepID=A0ABS0SSD0_9CAUL|nr:PQQ-dependent sugar dehydrogenase [Caulobacter hibisci]MBI1682251.1 PQQ-dependent sugar dehydrogenase [Caulobacter hibisci]
MRSSLIFAASALLAIAACGPGEAQDSAAPAVTADGGPVETRAANAPDQKPAFAGQTRAPLKAAGVAYQVQVVAKGLDHPWAIAFLPDGSPLVTERAGRLRLLAKDGTLSPAVAGLPAVDANGQGGLLGLAVDPHYAHNGLVYWSYAEPRDGGNGTSVARGKLVPGPTPKVESVQVIWRQTPALASPLHFGGRLVFARDGNLFVTTGERSIPEGRAQAQRLDGTLGKVIRIKPDGSIPEGNPFAGQTGAKPEIWSIGHRNLQAAAINPKTGELWTVEHGAKGGDELNIPRAGKNYGWPTITYGEEYSGKPIGDGITAKEGLEQPIYYWDPVIAPSGMAFYTADLFPAWKGSLLVGSMKEHHIARLTLDGDKVVGEERLLTEFGERIRDVVVGPDGAVWAVTDEEDGKVLRITPKG